MDGGVQKTHRRLQQLLLSAAPARRANVTPRRGGQGQPWLRRRFCAGSAVIEPLASAYRRHRRQPPICGPVRGTEAARFAGDYATRSLDKNLDCWQCAGGVLIVLACQSPTPRNGSLDQARRVYAGRAADRAWRSTAAVELKQRAPDAAPGRTRWADGRDDATTAALARWPLQPGRARTRSRAAADEPPPPRVARKRTAWAPARSAAHRLRSARSPAACRATAACRSTHRRGYAPGAIARDPPPALSQRASPPPLPPLPVPRRHTPPTAAQRAPRLPPALERRCSVVIALIALLKMRQPLLLPIAVAVVLTFVLTPAVRWLRRHGIPEALGAALLVADAAAASPCCSAFRCRAGDAVARSARPTRWRG